VTLHDFSCLRQVNLKISNNVLPSPTIPENDLPRMAESLKMTYQEWPNPALRQAGIGQAPIHQLSPDMTSPASQFAKLNRAFDETSSLKSSSGDKVVSRN
jgi:hypothetical protein